MWSLILIAPQLVLSVFSAFIVATVASLYQDYLRTRRLRLAVNNSPIINLSDSDYAAAAKEHATNLPALLAKGYESFKHGVYQIWSKDGFMTILGTDYIDELKSLPKDVLDFHAGAQKSMVGDWDWVVVGDDLIAQVILKDLTQNIASLAPDLVQELRRALPLGFQVSEEFTPVTVFPTIQRIVSLIAARTFVGPDLCHNESWLTISTGFAENVFAGGFALEQWKPILRPIAGRFFVPQIRKVWKIQADAERMIVPIMEYRRATEIEKPGYQKPNDMISWLMDANSRDKKPVSFAELSKKFLIASMAAIHTTTLTTTHALFDLAANKDCIEPLRQEILASADIDGNYLSKTAVGKMGRLDSFVKESQRLNPSGNFSFNRLIRKPVELSNGITLTSGSQVFVPAATISLDPTIWEDPAEFNGFRFFDLRSRSKEDAHRYQFVMATPQAMHFGIGRQSCPGRFFAAFVIKMTLAEVLTRYDLKVVDEAVGRPVNIVHGGEISPDDNAQVLFRLKEQN